MISTSFADFPPDAQDHAGALEGRTMLVRQSKVVPVECVARGYITGSALQEYQATGSVCGIRLPQDLRESDELPEPIFTPTTKADSGHDEPLTFDQACDVAGRETMERARDTTLALYRYAATRARERGIIVADTKFEFGITDGELILIDEALTPDSSRFWPASEYTPGRSQPSFDKQYVRDWLDKIGWDREAPAPELPDEVVDQTRERYIEAYERISGALFTEWLA
jgi:phosphoribosylaminoimidazole-succinocarboxamide synthase